MSQLTATSTSQINPVDPSERRTSWRVRADQIGSIIFKTGEEEKCMITNISIGGAEVIRYFIDELPDEFQIQIEENLKVTAKSVWNHGNIHGIMFKINAQ